MITPGPWTARGYVVISLKADKVVLLPALTDTHTTDELKANARLVAAAPELLVALYECAEFLDDYSDVNDGGDGPVPNRAMSLLQSVEAVIAKAVGR